MKVRIEEARLSNAFIYTTGKKCDATSKEKYSASRHHPQELAASGEDEGRHRRRSERSLAEQLGSQAESSVRCRPHLVPA